MLLQIAMRRWFPISLLIACSMAHAGENLDSVIVNSPAFLESHPDLRYRALGAEAYNDGKYREALDYFRRAARYADKPSQNLLASMHWNGIGCETDHAAAYAWMNLAAERGYADPVRMRDIYWQALSEDERKRALKLGKQLEAEYGDAQAKQREQTEVRFSLSHSFGAHPALASYSGFVNLRDQYGMFHRVDKSLYYSARFWQPKEYWQWQDEQWKPPAQGRVTVLPIVPLSGDKP